MTAGPPAWALAAIERVVDGLDVVAVDLDDVPVERAELVGDGAEAHDLGAGAVDLQAVVVDDRDEVGEALVGGEHRRLPDLALLQLAIAERQ